MSERSARPGILLPELRRAVSREEGLRHIGVARIAFAMTKAPEGLPQREPAVTMEPAAHARPAYLARSVAAQEVVRGARLGLGGRRAEACSDHRDRVETWRRRKFPARCRMLTCRPSSDSRSGFTRLTRAGGAAPRRRACVLRPCPDPGFPVLRRHASPRAAGRCPALAHRGDSRSHLSFSAGMASRPGAGIPRETPPWSSVPPSMRSSTPLSSCAGGTVRPSLPTRWGSSHLPRWRL